MINTYRQPGDENTNVQFRTIPATRMDGTVVDGKFEEQIVITVPGSKDIFTASLADHNMPDGSIRLNEYKERFKYDYEMWKGSTENGGAGTAIESWGALSDYQVRELKNANVYYVQQIANMTDGQLQKFGMGGLELRKKARDAIGMKSVDEGYVKSLEERLAAMEALLMQKDEAKRGRPRKEAE